MFTIGNGAMCSRGVFEEGFPGAMPACFVHRVWDDMPVNYTELANIPAWWDVDIWADGERFRLDRGRVLGYRRQLDLRTGALSRQVHWQPREGGPVLELDFERFINLADPHGAALQVTIKLAEGQTALRVRTGVNAHVENTGLLHWNLVDQVAGLDTAAVQVRTRATHTDLAVAMAVKLSSAGPWQSSPANPNGPGSETSGGLPQGSQVPNNRLKPPFQMSSAITFGIPTRRGRQLTHRGAAAIILVN